MKQGLLRENGGFNLVDSYINMNFNNIRNLGNPKSNTDAVPRLFVDGVVKELEEKINKRKQLIAVHARYCGPLEEGDYPFKFGGNSLENCEEVIKKNEIFKGLMSGFVMPHSGRIKKIVCEGLSDINFDKIINELIISLNEEQINILKKHFGKDDFKNDLIEKIKNTVTFFSKKNIDDPLLKGKTFFEIVKIKKKYSPNANILQDLFSPMTRAYVIIEKFEWIKVPIFLNNLKKYRLIMKILSYDIDINDPNLEEGDIINIRITDLQRDLFTKGDLLENILTSTVISLFSTLNFNFTFLIELDPL